MEASTGSRCSTIRLRTSPLYAPELTVGPQGWRAGGAQITLLEPPGTYTVKLSAGGRELTQPLVVEKDPHSEGTEAEIHEQMKTLEDLRKDAETTAGMINQMETVRVQIQGLVRMLEDREPDVRKSVNRQSAIAIRK